MSVKEHPFTILIVDDDESVLKLLDRLLSNQNFVIHTEPDGQKALEYIADGGINLLIVDYKTH